MLNLKLDLPYTGHIEISCFVMVHSGIHELNKLKVMIIISGFYSIIKRIFTKPMSSSKVFK